MADIGELQLEKTLVELHPDRSRDWAHQVMEVMQAHGLLLERVSGVYTFPHRTFQEYLAGAYLSVQGDFARQASHLAASGAFWREEVCMLVGRLIHLVGDTDKPLALVGEHMPDPGSGHGHRMAAGMARRECFTRDWAPSPT